ALHFLIDVQRGVFAEIAVLGNFTAQENGFFLLTVGQRPHVAHAPFADHVASDVGGALDIVACAGGDVPEEDFFSGTSTHQNRECALKEFLGVGVLVGFGKLHGQAQRHASGNDRDFVYRI